MYAKLESSEEMFKEMYAKVGKKELLEKITKAKVVHRGLVGWKIYLRDYRIPVGDNEVIHAYYDDAELWIDSQWPLRVKLVREPIPDKVKYELTGLFLEEGNGLVVKRDLQEVIKGLPDGEICIGVVKDMHGKVYLIFWSDGDNTDEPPADWVAVFEQMKRKEE